jgi:iron complex outermembrane receptor protein
MTMFSTRLLMRCCLFVLALVGAASTLPAASAQAETATYNFDIPAQSLANALEAFGRTCNQQLVFDKLILRDKQNNALVGRYSAEEGITRLLEGSGLTYKRTAKGVLAVLAIEPPNPSASPHSERFEDFGQISEIIVTAQKKGDERLQEVPVPVTVLNANQIADQGEVLLRDYYASVPGLNVSPNILGQQMVSIRGITTGGFSNPTVAILVDDVAFGASTNSLSSNLVPDIDPGDLARVEVLRGPQGTLYGASSMGGLIKFVTKDPSPSEYSGRLETGFNEVHHGAEPGFNLRGSANIPLGEDAAIRVSGFERQDAGYIDNVVNNEKGVNQANAYGARVALLWQPRSDFSLKISALYQNIKSNGTSDVDTRLGDLQQSYIPGAGAYETSIQAYSATLDYKLGNVDITSVTGYNKNRTFTLLDYTWALGQCCTLPVTNGATGGTVYDEHYPIDRVSEELRFTGNLWTSVDWQAGGYYTHEDTPNRSEIVYAENANTGQIQQQILNSGPEGIRLTFEEYAAFLNLTYHVTDKFDVQIGGRESYDRETDFAVTEIGPYTPYIYSEPSPYVAPTVESNGNAFTYLLTPRYRVSSDLMVYARLASGYRPGGPNGFGLVAQGAPPSFAPDKTQNYEVGLKGDFFDHLLSVDTSIYYIDWKNIQIQLLTPTQYAYSANGGAAKSQGAELSLTLTPRRGLSIAGWADFDDAVLTENFPANSSVEGKSGDRLPNSSRWSANISAQQDFPLKGRANGFVGAQVSYVGDRIGQFTTPPPRAVFPSYTRADLRAGVNYESWTTTLYANNIGDRRGVLNAGATDLSHPFSALYIQPRTVGLTITKSFQ